MAGKKRRPNNKASSKFIFWIVGVVAVLFGVLIFLSNSNSPSDTESSSVDINYDGQPVLGEESAPVKIVEFGDYKCSHCKNFHESFFPQIEKDLVDTGKASFHFINYSFLNIDSTRSAKFAESVLNQLGNVKFWEFHDLIFEKQEPGSESLDVFTQPVLEDMLKEIATEEEVNKVVDYFEQDLADDAWNTDMNLAKELNVQSTPTLFINGERFAGESYDDFLNAVEQAANEE